MFHNNSSIFAHGDFTFLFLLKGKIQTLEKELN